MLVLVFGFGFGLCHQVDAFDPNSERINNFGEGWDRWAWRGDALEAEGEKSFEQRRKCITQNNN